MSRSRRWASFTLILLIAAALRFWGLGDIPPGLSHDEVANWLIARDILDGHHAIYFTAAYGHEPLYQYAQAATVALFGDHWLGLRYASAAFGMVGLAFTYALAHRLFGARVGMLTLGWAALSFWPLFYSRVALRAITLPAIAGLAAYVSLRAIRSRERRHWLLAGGCLGLSFYTYMAARILPAIVLAIGLYLLLVRRRSIPWRGVGLGLLVAALIAAPLALWLMSHPGAEYRVGEVSRPLDRLLAGDPRPVLENLQANLRFFTVAGDRLVQQNLPGRPVFADALNAVLFTVGIVLAIWRWRDPRYGSLLIWLIGALGPSVATVDAPSSIRNALALNVVFIFPALATVELGRWLHRRLHAPAAASVVTLSALALALTGALTVRDYFTRWPQQEATRFHYQAGLTAVARRLDRLPPQEPVAVGGLSVYSMDGPGLDLAARSDVSHVRLCDPRQTLILPGGNGRLLVPDVVPIDPALRERLLAWGARVQVEPAYTAYRLPEAAEIAPSPEQDVEGPLTLPTSFDSRLAFLGYEVLEAEAKVAPGETLTLRTYWRIEQPSSVPLKIFVHLMGEGETPLAQGDGLGSPPRGWQMGDVIVQHHAISLPADLAAGQYRIQLGVFEPESGARLTTQARDRLVLEPEVIVD